MRHLFHQGEATGQTESGALQRLAAAPAALARAALGAAGDGGAAFWAAVAALPEELASSQVRAVCQRGAMIPMTRFASPRPPSHLFR